jgi:recombination protein RecA
VKNKVAPPFRSAEFDILFNEGISKESSIIDVATELDVLKKSGSWFEYNGEKISQGREGARVYLKENPKVRDEIEKKIHEAVKLKHEIPLQVGISHEESPKPSDEELQ